MKMSSCNGLGRALSLRNFMRAARTLKPVRFRTKICDFQCTINLRTESTKNRYPMSSGLRCMTAVNQNCFLFA